MSVPNGYSKSNKYKPGPGLPFDVIKHVKPIFGELTNENLMKKCTHGQTQNQNESFNAIIWKRVSKDEYVGRRVFEIGVNDAASHFNIGNIATIRTYKHLGMEPGTYTKLGCSLLNVSRVKNSIRHHCNFNGK